MLLYSKAPISIKSKDGKAIIIPKDTKGHLIAVSNSEHIIKQFPEIETKIKGMFYICSFPGYVEETLCNLEQVEIMEKK